MDGPSFPTTIDEVFGYALPGYLLTFFIFLLAWAFNLFRSTAFYLGAVAILGLPIGYLWTYAFYHPIIWGKCSGRWDNFSLNLGKRLTRGLAPTEKEAKLVTNRAFSYLRWVDPSIGKSLVFFHVRHHTLRSSGVVLAVGTIIASIVVSARVPLAWAALGGIATLAIGWTIAWFLLCSASTELDTLIDHYTFVAANSGQLSRWARNFLKLHRAL